MKRYLCVWIILSLNSFRSFFHYRFGAVVFLVGKVIRFLLFFGFLYLLLSKTKILNGYNIWQVVLFFLTFNFIDSATQMLFRDVYRFRQHILTGNFDLLLVKPVNCLFRILLGGADFLDFITLFPFVIFLFIAMAMVPNVTFLGVIFYFLLIANALLIAASFHILVMALAVMTTEIDHAIMIYRDFTGMGKIPVDIYTEPVRSLITFVIPVGIMMTFPVKSLMGLINPLTVIMTIFGSLIFFFICLFIWNLSLKSYTSASS